MKVCGCFNESFGSKLRHTFQQLEAATPEDQQTHNTKFHFSGTEEDVKTFLMLLLQTDAVFTLSMCLYCDQLAAPVSGRETPGLMWKDVWI